MSTFLPNLVCGLGYFFAARFGQLFAFGEGAIASMFWPAAGIASFAFLTYGRRVLPGIFLAALLVNSFISGSPIAGLIVAVGSLGSAFGASYIIRHKLGFQQDLGRTQDILLLIVFGGILGSGVNAAFGVLSLKVANATHDHYLLQNFYSWWWGDGMGVIAVTPVLLTFTSKACWADIQGRPRLFIVLTLIVAAVCYAAIGMKFNFGDLDPTLAFLVFPAGLLQILCFGRIGAATICLIIYSTALYFTYQNLGVFQSQQIEMRFMVMWLLSCSAIVCAFILAAKQTTVMRYAERMSEAMIEATRANRVKSEFLANISHEIRTPMTAILGHAEFSQMLLKDDDAASKVDKSLQIIRNSGQGLLDLLDSLLDISRAEVGQLKVVKSPFTAFDPIQHALQLMSTKAAQKNLVLDSKCQVDSELKIYSDHLRIRQIAINLVGNAIKFTDTGCITAGCKIKDHPRTGVRSLCYFVSDTGCGIPAEAMDRVFKPFEQGKHAINSGVGLGLAICKEISVALAGDLVVTSQPGKGSSFEFYLDLANIETNSSMLALRVEAEQVRDDGMFPGCAAVNGSARILVVDDAAELRTLYALIVGKLGFAVDVAEDGLDAIEKLTAANKSETWNAFDLVFMDLRMPKIDGLSATRRLRDEGCTVPIIAITADDADMKERSLASGCNDFLMKPLNAHKIADSIKRNLGQTQAGYHPQ